MPPKNSGLANRAVNAVKNAVNRLLGRGNMKGGGKKAGGGKMKGAGGGGH